MVATFVFGILSLSPFPFMRVRQDFAQFDIDPLGWANNLASAQTINNFAERHLQLFGRRLLPGRRGSLIIRNRQNRNIW